MLVDSSGSMNPERADGDTVLIPELLAHAGGELKFARIAERAAVEVGHESRRRLVVADVSALNTHSHFQSDAAAEFATAIPRHALSSA